MFNEQELQQIKEHDLKLSDVEYQIDKFINGFPPTRLEAAALVGNGVSKLSEEEADEYISYYESNLSDLDIVKFVPASGAATRMFKNLYAFYNAYNGSDEAYEKMKADQSSGSIYEFFENLESFAFYDDLKGAYEKANDHSLEEARIRREYVAILEILLEEKGLNYGSLPKGLLKFHGHDEGARTPAEEHMVEGAQYAKDANGNVKIHFTVSPAHQAAFEEHVAAVKGKYEKKYGVKISISYSTQKSSTDTIAVDLDNKPFLNEDQSILFRPAGHGALLENLNDLDADIVFIKNIDNVVPDHLKDDTIKYKRAIAGVLLKYHHEIKESLQGLESISGIERAKALLNDHLGYRLGVAFDSMEPDQQVATLTKLLKRPLRVCGMVKNEGDPGGGPFWVKDTDGNTSLQIVETAQIDLENPHQKEVFNQATHFNPTDLVCYLKDVDGKPIDLMKARDPLTGFVTQKSANGRDLKAQELPGLWNGSMAHWNTIFIVVPESTFNPVKSVNDLLKEAHQPG